MQSESVKCPYCGVAIPENVMGETVSDSICRICKNEFHVTEKTCPARFVTVYVPRNESEHMLAQSILKSVNIEFFSKNFTVQNLFGAGQIGTGFNIVTGPIQLQVPEEDAEEAGALLRDYFSAQPLDDKEFGYDEPEEDTFTFQKQINKMVNRAMIFSVFWFGGIGASMAIYYALKALRMIDDSTEKMQGKWRAIFALIFASLEVIISPYLWMEILYDLNVF